MRAEAEADRKAHRAREKARKEEREDIQGHRKVRAAPCSLSEREIGDRSLSLRSPQDENRTCAQLRPSAHALAPAPARAGRHAAR